jgi:manganese/zinc/iron transport system substrate-binding protein
MNTLWRRWAAVGATAAVFLSSSAAEAEDRIKNPARPPVKVVATVTMATDLVRQVGGDRVAVDGLMGPGVDPHLYKATAQDATRLAGADVIFYVGLSLEGRMADMFARLGQQGKNVYALSASIPRDRLLAPEEFEGHWDSHVWGDPELWAACLVTVVEGLATVDPEGRAAYESRAAAYREELVRLRDWGRKRLAEVPANRRILVTSHDAFNYFGRAFDLAVVGVQGISTANEAGLADIAKTVDFVKKNQLRSIFVETSVNPAAVERIAKDAGVRIGGELFSDATGEPGKMEEGGGERYDVGTYIGMLKHNIHVTVEGLR